MAEPAGPPGALKQWRAAGGARRAPSCGPCAPRRLHRRSVALAARSRLTLNPRPFLFFESPAPGARTSPRKALRKHLWGESSANGRHRRAGALRVTNPACAPTRARRWGTMMNADVAGSHRSSVRGPAPAPFPASDPGWGRGRAGVRSTKPRKCAHSNRPSRMTRKAGGRPPRTAPARCGRCYLSGVPLCDQARARATAPPPTGPASLYYPGHFAASAPSSDSLKEQRAFSGPSGVVQQAPPPKEKFRTRAPGHPWGIWLASVKFSLWSLTCLCIFLERSLVFMGFPKESVIPERLSTTEEAFIPKGRSWLPQTRGNNSLKGWVLGFHIPPDRLLCRLLC